MNNDESTFKTYSHHIVFIPLQNRHLSEALSNQHWIQS